MVVKKIEVIHQCENCKDKMKLNFAKPNLITHTFFKHQCSVCNTNYEIKAKFKKGTGFKTIDFETKLDKKFENEGKLNEQI